MAPRTASETEEFILDLVQNYHEPWCSTTEQPPNVFSIHNLEFSSTKERFTNSSTPPPPPLLKLLDQTPLIRYLELKDILALRGVNQQLKTAVHAQLESRIVEYFRPSSDLIRVVDTILHETDGGGWQTFMYMVLIPLMVRIENRCRPRKIVPPLLYRIFLLRQLVRALDGSEEMLYRPEHSDNIRWFCDLPSKMSPRGRGWLYAVEEDHGIHALGCPDLYYFERETLIVFPDCSFEDDIENDSEDEEDRALRALTLHQLWDRSLPVFAVDDCFAHFALTPPPVASSSNENDEASLTVFNNQDRCLAYGMTIDQPFNVLKLLVLCFSTADFEYDPSETPVVVYWCDPHPLILVLWYTFLVAMRVSPFVEASEECSPSELWEIVSNDESSMDKFDENTKRNWTEAMQYYSSLSLYSSSPRNDRKRSSSRISR